MNEKLFTNPDEGSSIKQLFLNNMLLFEYDPRNKKNQWVEKEAEKVMCECIGGVHFIQKMAESMGAAYKILESFAEPMRFLRRLLESAETLVIYLGMLLHAFMIWAGSTLLEEDALKEVLNRTNWDPILNFAIPDRDRKRCKEEIM